MRNGCAGAFVTAMALAALAFASDGARPEGQDPSSTLSVLTWLFVGGALLFSAISLLLGAAFLARWAWRYFKTARIPPRQWYARYWPLQHLLEVSGVLVDLRDWAGDVPVTCEVRLGDETVNFSAVVGMHSHGPVSVQFGQREAGLRHHPSEGTPTTIKVVATPRWWRGRPAELAQEVRLGITDHRSEDRKATDAVLETTQSLLAEARDLQARAISGDRDPPLLTAENWRLRTKAFLREHFGAYESDFESAVRQRKTERSNIGWDVANAPIGQMKL